MSEVVVNSEPSDGPPTREELAERLTKMEREKDAEIQELRGKVDQLESELERRPNVELEDPTDIKTLTIGGLPVGVILAGKMSRSELEAEDENGKSILDWFDEMQAADIENLLEVDQRLTNEQKTRSRQDGLIRREINKLADDLDIDLKEVDVSGEDKIQRLIAHGPDDIADRVYPVHERAREVLLHGGEWGRTVDDDFGKRITFTAPTIRQELERERNENLQSKQVRDVFEKIVELADDSPRKARVGKTDDGNTKLRIHLQQEEM